MSHGFWDSIDSIDLADSIDFVEFDEFDTVNIKHDQCEEKKEPIDIIFDDYECNQDFLENYNDANNGTDKEEQSNEVNIKSYLTDDNMSTLEKAKQLLNKIKYDNNKSKGIN